MWDHISSKCSLQIAKLQSRICKVLQSPGAQKGGPKPPLRFILFFILLFVTNMVFTPVPQAGGRGSRSGHRARICAARIASIAVGAPCALRAIGGHAARGTRISPGTLPDPARGSGHRASGIGHRVAPSTPPDPARAQPIAARGSAPSQSRAVGFDRSAAARGGRYYGGRAGHKKTPALGGGFGASGRLSRGGFLNGAARQIHPLLGLRAGVEAGCPARGHPRSGAAG